MTSAAFFDRCKLDCGESIGASRLLRIMLVILVYWLLRIIIFVRLATFS